MTRPRRCAATSAFLVTLAVALSCAAYAAGWRAGVDRADTEWLYGAAFVCPEGVPERAIRHRVPTCHPGGIDPRALAEAP